MKFTPKYFFFLGADYRSEIRFVISRRLSEQQAHFEWEALAVGRSVCRLGQVDN